MTGAAESVVAGVADGVDGSTGGVEGGVVGVAGTGASFTRLGAGGVTTGGVAAATFSKYHAAAKPSCPCAVRTRTH